MRPAVFPDDRQFWFETLRILGHTAYGGSDVGEVLTIAEQISSGDYDSWHDAWHTAADRISVQAQASLDAGHRISARDAFLRASTYYSTAEFFLHGNPDDPRINAAYERGAGCFAAAAELYFPAVRPIRIPYENTVLEGWFYRARDDAAQLPTLVIHNGFDGSAEELHYLGGLAGVERDYNVLTFDGPGQPSAIHRRGLVLRPDWEKVVGPVLDHLETLPGVNQERIALMGVSLGGMLAPRAAAHDPRVAALIVFDGVYDAAEALTGLLPMPRAEVERRARDEHDAGLDDLLDASEKDNPTLRWALGHGRYVTGSATLASSSASTSTTTSATGTPNASLARCWSARPVMTSSSPAMASPSRSRRSCSTTSERPRAGALHCGRGRRRSRSRRRRTTGHGANL